MKRASAIEIEMSLHAALAEGMTLCAAMALGAESDAPEWVHLLPAGEIRTADPRGPYTADLNAIAASLRSGDRLVLDENHSTDLAAPEGRPAPAMGWITQMQARADGLWGRVEWTEPGRALVAGKAYRGVSPVLQVIVGTKKVAALLRASLVNRPNIQDLVTLHQETALNPLLAKLIAALGLATTTSEDTLVAAVTSLNQAQTAHTTELMSIATAAGLKAGDKISADTIVGAIGRLAPAGDAASIVALQAELATVTTELNTLRSDGKRAKAETFIDGAIKEGRVGVKPLRDHYITRHMADAASVEKEIAAFPKLDGTSIVPAGRPAGEAETSLNAAQAEAARVLGIKPDDYLKTLNAERQAA